jgi:hypothetical protein
MYPDNLFDTEIAYFEAHRQEWVANHYGKFAVLQGEAVYGFFDTGLNAYESGVRQFGNTPFMIKEVLPEDFVLHIPALTHGLMYAHH